MTEGKKTDDAKKGANMLVVDSTSKSKSPATIQTVSAPLISLQSDSLFASAKKDAPDLTKEDKKAEPKKEDKKEERKDDKKAATGPAIQTGPTLDDLALQQTPTQEETLAKKSAQTKAGTTADDTKSKGDDKKTDVLVSSRLEDIAAQQRLSQQRERSTEYRVPTTAGPQSTYQSNSQASDPASIYRPGNASALYNSNKHEEVQRGGVVTQYDRNDLHRTLGHDGADALLEERRRQIHGDKGLLEKYDRR